MNQLSAMQTEKEKAQLIRLQAELFEENGVSLGSYVTEGEDRLIIGSSKRADLVVPHASVSQIHAMLRIMGENDILLYDLGSEAGTYVSGQKIVERKLTPGEIFEIGGHRVKVNLLEQSFGALGTERSLFWRSTTETTTDFLEVLRFEQGIVREERTLSKNGRIIFGRRKNEMLLGLGKPGEAFLHRKDSGKSNNVDCRLPTGYQGEVYDGNNELIRVIEQEGSIVSFNEREKVRLISSDQTKEILIFWRPQGTRTNRSSRDAESPALQRSFLICSTIAGIILAIMSYVPLKEETPTEAEIPKTSYYRLSMDSAPVAPALDQGAQSQDNNQQAPASKAASISSSISKLLNKKSTLTAESIQQAISQNGNATTRMNNLKSANLKSEEIPAGAVGGGSVNVNAISAGLAAGGGGGAGSLKGFAGGRGTKIGAGSGFGGKGFDMSLGGDEAEAIGGLDKSLIAAVVQSNIGQIKHCYERQLIVNPNLFGKIVAQWTITKDGVVSTSSVKKTTMNNSAVENCIVSKIKGWNFPKPKGGGQVIVSYPFLFKSLN